MVWYGMAYAIRRGCQMVVVSTREKPVVVFGLFGISITISYRMFIYVAF